MMKKILLISLFIFIGRIFTSCNKAGHQPEIHIRRMEKDLFECPPETLKDSIPVLYARYNPFFQLFTEAIINIGDSSNPSFAEYLTNFVTNYGVYLSYQESQKVFADMSGIEKSLEKAFGRYLELFPGEKIPVICSFISGYLQGIAALDTIVAIGLDMYLGRNYEPYAIMWPDKKYKRYNLHPAKIPSDVIQFWAMSRYPFGAEENTVLANMLYHGKIWYFTRQLMPDEPDTLVFGFSPLQLQWCQNNEKQMWTYLVEHQLLYNSNYMTVHKLVGEGPFTYYFTRESPARAAVWLGYRIISSYMKNNPGISLEQLMKDNDYVRLLSMSKYKP